VLCARAEHYTRNSRDLPAQHRRTCERTNTNTILPVTENLNQWYQSGDQAFIIVASAMVLVMIPGLAFLYSGLARRKSALSMIWACMFSASVITFQWYFWGYSLAFGPSTNGFIGNLDKFGLKGVLGAPSQGSPLIPELLYSFYQVCIQQFGKSQHRANKYDRCNSALSLLPLSSAVLPSAVVLSL
jgi:hypothetical protein